MRKTISIILSIAIIISMLSIASYSKSPETETGIERAKKITKNASVESLIAKLSESTWAQYNEGMSDDVIFFKIKAPGKITVTNRLYDYEYDSYEERTETVSYKREGNSIVFVSNLIRKIITLTDTGLDEVIYFDWFDVEGDYGQNELLFREGGITGEIEVYANGGNSVLYQKYKDTYWHSDYLSEIENIYYLYINEYNAMSGLWAGISDGGEEYNYHCSIASQMSGYCLSVDLSNFMSDNVFPSFDCEKDDYLYSIYLTEQDGKLYAIYEHVETTEFGSIGVFFDYFIEELTPMTPSEYTSRVVSYTNNGIYKNITSVDGLIKKLKTKTWGVSDALIDHPHGNSFYHINSNNELIYYIEGFEEFEEIYPPETIKYDYNPVENEAAIEFYEKTDNNIPGFEYAKCRIIDIGFDDILLFEESTTEYNSYDIIFSVTPNNSKTIDILENTYWHSENLSEEKNNYIHFLPGLAYTLFPDVESNGHKNGDYYYPYVFWSYDSGVGADNCLSVSFYDDYIFDTHFTVQDNRLYAVRTTSDSVDSVYVEELFKYFPDVKEGDWYYDVVKHVASKGYITGYSNGHFGPSDNLKRQDFVCILARIAGADLSKYNNKTSKLKDVKKGAYYAPAVNWAIDKGYINGYQNGKFGVNDPITREQVATILYNYMGKPAVEYTDDYELSDLFTDYNKISSFAKKPMFWAVENKTISGMGNGTISPTSCATRAQIAAIIQRMDSKGMFNL